MIAFGTTAAFVFSLFLHQSQARELFTIHARNENSKSSSQLMMEKNELHHRSLDALMSLPDQAADVAGTARGGGLGGGLGGGVGSGVRGGFLNRRKLQTSSENSPDPSEVHVDFVVAGFPKSGTTTLLKAFEKHPETAMASEEECAIADPTSDEVALKELDATLQSLPDEPNLKRGFKCPTAVFTHKAISRVHTHSADAKFIIGVRHPVWMIQSFYNYRVTEIHERGLDEEIPTFEEVLAQEEAWKGVSTDVTRCELFLTQFAKTAFDPSDVKELMTGVHPGYDLAIEPNEFEIFLYDLEQLEDSDETRSAAFRQELASFLNLNSPLDPLEDENHNHFTGHKGLANTIDICQPQYDEVRRDLVEKGSQTARWLIEEFMESPDVTVANKDHLTASLQSWGRDPCPSSMKILAEA